MDVKKQNCNTTGEGTTARGFSWADVLSRTKLVQVWIVN